MTDFHGVCLPDGPAAEIERQSKLETFTDQTVVDPTHGTLHYPAERQRQYWVRGACCGWVMGARGVSSTPLVLAYNRGHDFGAGLRWAANRRAAERAERQRASELADHLRETAVAMGRVVAAGGGL